MDLSEDLSGGADNSAGSQAQRPPPSTHDGAGLPTANHSNPVQVMPCQIQMFAKFDDQGRRYMVLENLPLEKNYVANCINNGAEFAIGGNPEFISDALTNELAARVVQDSRNQYTQSWHVVVFPDSNMSNAPMSQLYRGSEATERYSIATALRPICQNYQNNAQTNQKAVSLQHRQYDQQATFVQQPMLTHSSAMGGHGRGDSSVSRCQQSQFTTPMSNSFINGGGSTMMFPQEQLYSLTPHQGSFQGFGPNSGPTQGNYQGQSDNLMFNPNSAFPMEPLPQVRRPIFDKYGYIVGDGGAGNRNDGNMYGGNLFNENMYRARMGNTSGFSQPFPFQGSQQQFNSPQQVQNTEIMDPQQVQDTEMRRDPQLAAAAQSFYSFVTNKMDQDENVQDEDDRVDDYQDDGDFEEKNPDEGIAMGTTSGKNANSSSSQPAPPNQQAPPPPSQPESPPTEVLLASEREPYRFFDNTGIGLCDYCGRDGHEAEACLKWDPVHYDKPVCTACNNDQHSLDECPRFRAMPTPEKQRLLLDKGAGRPGVRSQYNPWTSYVHRDGYRISDAGLPLTRRFLFNLSVSPESGAMLQNIWKVWDYGQGVPDQFQDPRAESLAGDPAAPVDERFMGGKHGLGWNVHPPVGFGGSN